MIVLAGWKGLVLAVGSRFRKFPLTRIRTARTFSSRSGIQQLGLFVYPKPAHLPDPVTTAGIESSLVVHLAQAPRA
jgi:hypothetical protein